MGNRRVVRVGGLAVLVALATALGAGFAGAAPTQSTLPSIYTPFTDSGSPAGPVLHKLRGSCFSGSDAVDHAGAWRCESGNALFDPCFSSPHATGFVLCPATGPWSPRLIKLTLTKPLPKRLGNHGRPSTKGLPWALVTSTGSRCRLDTGATAAIGRRRLNYFCTGTKLGLWGAPTRTTEPWTIFIAPDQATTLTQTVGIRFAWF